MHGNSKINEREIIRPSQKLHKNWKCIKLETDIDGGPFTVLSYQRTRLYVPLI